MIKGQYLDRLLHLGQSCLVFDHILICGEEHVEPPLTYLGEHTTPYLRRTLIITTLIVNNNSTSSAGLAL